MLMQTIIDFIKKLLSLDKKDITHEPTISRWTHEDHEVILDNFPLLTDKELGALLNRSEVAVKSYRQRHAIRKKASTK